MGKVFLQLKTHLCFIERLTIVVCISYCAIAISFRNYFSNWMTLVQIDLILITFIIIFAYPANFQKLKSIKITRLIYFVFIIYALYLQANLFITAFREHPIDETLIAIDKFMFRTNPTDAVEFLVTPWLTEYLQITYSLFYFIPITHLVELIIWSDYRVAYKFTSAIVIGYYILFVLYFTFPAIGPRHTLHDISSVDKERPGIWLALPFRHAVDNSDSILTVDEPYKSRPNRDCMPSGHTIFTLIAIISAFYLQTKFRWFLLVWGSSAIFATIYLRYHYVIDLIFGAFIGLIIAGFLLNAYREKFYFQEVYQRITALASIRFENSRK